MKGLSKRIRNSAEQVEADILRDRKPTLQLPVRSLQNVQYNPRKGYFSLGKKRKARTLTVNTVKTFAQTLKMIATSKSLIDTQEIATKREMYYISKNWGDARFLEQDVFQVSFFTVVVRIAVVNLN